MPLFPGNNIAGSLLSQSLFSSTSTPPHSTYTPPSRHTTTRTQARTGKPYPIRSLPLRSAPVSLTSSIPTSPILPPPLCAAVGCYGQCQPVAALCRLRLRGCEAKQQHPLGLCYWLMDALRSAVRFHVLLIHQACRTLSIHGVAVYIA